MAMQEGGRVINGVVDALKSQPLSLALVVMNLALLALFYFIAIRNADSRKHEFELVFAQQQRTMEIMSKCDSK